MSISVRAARIELLVLSDLTSDPAVPYTEADVRAALRRVLAEHRGIHAAIADAAGELGDHPDTWQIRFRWAAVLVDDVYPGAPRRRNALNITTCPAASI